MNRLLVALLLAQNLNVTPLQVNQNGVRVPNRVVQRQYGVDCGANVTCQVDGGWWFLSAAAGGGGTGSSDGGKVAEAFSADASFWSVSAYTADASYSSVVSGSATTAATANVAYAADASYWSALSYTADASYRSVITSSGVADVAFAADASYRSSVSYTSDASYLSVTTLSGVADTAFAADASYRASVAYTSDASYSSVISGTASVAAVAFSSDASYSSVIAGSATTATTAAVANVAFSSDASYTALQLAADPVACSAGQFVTDLTAAGVLTCSTPAGGASPVTTRGDIYVHDGGVASRLAVGADGLCLKSNSTAATGLGLEWNTCSATSAYSTVADEGVALTQRGTVNLIGAGVTCVDNSGAASTDCTIPGGAGGKVAEAYAADASITAMTATALSVDPTACTAGQYVSDIAANGTLTCGTPAGGGSADSGSFIIRTLANYSSNSITTGVPLTELGMTFAGYSYSIECVLLRSNDAGTAVGNTTSFFHDGGVGWQVVTVESCASGVINRYYYASVAGAGQLVKDSATASNGVAICLDHVNMEIQDAGAGGMMLYAGSELVGGWSTVWAGSYCKIQTY